MRVILLIADGVRPDTLCAAMDAGVVPAMRRMREEGGMHQMTSTFPSVTGPAYAPFLMGRFPGPVGLPGLRWFDRARTACRFPDYSRSYVGYQMGAMDGDLDPSAPTIFEIEPDSAAALSGIARGLSRKRKMARLTPLTALRAALTHFRGNVAGWLDVDREVSRLVVEHVAEHATRFVFAAFTGVDKTSHAWGHDSPRVLDALRIVDDTIAAIRADLEARGQWRDTWLWVTSDHGHSPVRMHEDLAGLVEQQGFRVLAHPWLLRPRANAAVMVSGNAMAHVYLHLERRERPFLAGLGEAERRLADTLVQRDSVDLLLVPLDAGSCEIRSGRGTAVVRRQGGRYSYERRQGDPLRLGRDVADANSAEAHALTRGTDYPDAIVQIAWLASAPRCGDLVLSAARGWDFRARYEPIPHVSSHGALHREHMLVPLLTSRPFSRAPVRTTDLMPTALAILGHPAPPMLDGESAV
jgi:hypothetical protein